MDRAFYALLLTKGDPVRFLIITSPTKPVYIIKAAATPFNSTITDDYTNCHCNHDEEKYSECDKKQVHNKNI